MTKVFPKPNIETDFMKIMSFRLEMFPNEVMLFNIWARKIMISGCVV